MTLTRLELIDRAKSLAHKLVDDCASCPDLVLDELRQLGGERAIARLARDILFVATTEARGDESD